MNPVFLSRLAFDFVAAGLLLVGLAYWWLGNTVHELVGTAMFLLLVVHNVFNRRWYGTIRKTREARGAFNVVITLVLATAMLTLVVTSVLISHALAGVMSPYAGFTVRQMHVLAAYWVLVVVAVHLGLRWPMIMGVARSLAGISKARPARARVLRAVTAAIAIHGVWSWFELGLGTKLAMEMTLDWWNFEESVAGFFVHCAAIAGLCMAVTYYTVKWGTQRTRRTALGPAAVALSLALASSGAAEASDRTSLHGSAHLQVGDSIGDILRHPAFAGFARLILPWDDRAYDESLRLREIGALLPYHSNVSPTDVVSALNLMIDEAGKGRTVFYDIYTEAERRADPTKRNTGLFFIRGKPGAPFAVISPGGGFSYVGSVHEGFPYASEIAKAGYNAFVLKYRAGQGGTVATQDLAAALSFIFRTAARLGVGTDGFSLWGSSAGARMAASIGSHGAARFGGDDLPKPATVVMAYTGHSGVAADEPPTFAVVGEQDGIAPPSAMERRVAALRRAGTEVEFRRYGNLGHGFGLGTGTSAEGWVTDAIRFWETSGRKRTLAPRAPRPPRP